MIFLLITTLLREMSQSGMFFFTYFYNGCLPTSAIYMMHRGHFFNIMPVCALSAAENLAAVFDRKNYF